MWQELAVPQVRFSDLDTNTPTYTDAYVALHVRGIPYAVYVRDTPKVERLFNQLYLALHAAKEKRAMQRAQEAADADRAAQQAIVPMQNRY